jgi:hypothetical protein
MLNDSTNKRHNRNDFLPSKFFAEISGDSKINRQIDETNEIKRFIKIRRPRNMRLNTVLVACPIIGNKMKNFGISEENIIVYDINGKPHPHTPSVWETPDGRTCKFLRDNGDGTITLHNFADWQQDWKSDEVKHIGVVMQVLNKEEVDEQQKQWLN